MIFFATPCYRSDPNEAIAWAKAMATELGIAGTVCQVQVGCPWLHVAYACLARSFLAGGQRLMMMRDDDVWPTPPVVARMVAAVDAGADAVVAPYKIRDGERFDVVLGPGGAFRSAGLGCALVHRRVLAQLWTAYAGELGWIQEGAPLVAIFRDQFAERDDGVELMKEDQAFWWRVVAAGFRVDVLEDVDVMHAGASALYRKEHSA